MGLGNWRDDTLEKIDRVGCKTRSNLQRGSVAPKGLIHTIFSRGTSQVADNVTSIISSLFHRPLQSTAAAECECELLPLGAKRPSFQYFCLVLFVSKILLANHVTMLSNHVLLTSVLFEEVQPR